MAIGIQGVRLAELTINLNDKSTSYKPTGSYEILTTAGRVLAKQTIGGYGGIEVPASVETTRALNAFVTLYNKDIASMLGLDASEPAPLGA